MAHRIVAVKCNDKGQVVAMKTEDGAIHALPLSIANMRAGDYLGVQAMNESMDGGYYLQGSMGIDKQGNIKQLAEFE